MVLYSLCLFSFSYSWARYSLPTQLTSDNQKKVSEILGFSSAAKMNFSPDPLGGYQGLQISVSRDFANLSQIKSVGSSQSDMDYFGSSQLALGKGLYYDFDIFFIMTPPQDQDYSQFGGLLRWRFKEYSEVGVSLGLMAQVSGSQYSSAFGSRNTGADLYSYWSLNKFKFLLGVGQARSISTFVGGSSGLTSSSSSQSEDQQVDVLSSHVWGSLSYVWNPWVITLGYDRYVDDNYSLRIGYNL